VKLIAEPWDVGPGGYQVAHFPPGWAEWNDKYRDTVRAYWKGDEGKLSELATRMAGSADMFNHRGRRPWASVNFVTAHDGFTLNDLVSYNDKHNDANGEENRDGSSNNVSWNHGAEGATEDSKIINLRERQKRNLLATLLLSQGTPMMVAGDEIGHTQNGNNNAYCQDNELTWIDWSKLNDGGRRLMEFVRRVIQIRNQHPILQRGRFLAGTHNPHLDVKDVTWLTPEGIEIQEAQWSDAHAKCLGMMLDGRAQESGVKQRGEDETLLVITNAHHDVVNFKLPEVAEGKHWVRLLDTNDPTLARAEYAFGSVYQVTGRSLLLFQLMR
jgi:glycogen operon protein